MVLRDKRILISMVSHLVGKSHDIPLAMQSQRWAQTDQTSALLGVERTATPDQIKKAYRKVRISHSTSPLLSTALC